MKIYGLTEGQARNVVADVSQRWWGANVIVRDSRDMSNSRGGRAQVTLRVVDGRDGMPGARGATPSLRDVQHGTGPHGLARLSNATCWHAHRDVLRAWFMAGATRVHTAMADYRRDTFEQQFPETAYRNIGSMMYPAYMPELCECVHGTGWGPRSHAGPVATDDAAVPFAPYNVVGAIMDYEQGDLSHDEMIRLFQHLVDTGQAWSLQGHYGRQAQALIDAGYVHTPETV